MSQHDFNIANQGFPATRADLNNALAALASSSAGTSEPSTTYAGQMWNDTTNNLLKFRNDANDAWITFAKLDQATNEWEIRSSVFQAVDSAGIAFKTDEGTTRATLGDDGNFQFNSVDINGGTIDGTIIGGTTPAAITATTFESTGIDDNATSTAMTLDSSNNLLVGKTSTGSTVAGIVLGSNDKITATRASGPSAAFVRTGSDGSIVDFQKDGTPVGRIGVRDSTSVFIESAASGRTGLDFTGGVLPRYNGNLSDNQTDLGAASYRFDDIYATNGTIQTSDRNEKQQIAALTAAEMAAAKAISTGFKTFKWNDSVAEKGDAARVHSGVIAQEVEQAVTDAGLDAGDYAFFISNTWWETQTDVPAVEAAEAVYKDVVIPAVLDDEGNEVEPETTKQRLVSEAVEAKEAYTRTDTYNTAEEAPEGATERNRKGIRYPQLLAFVGAATEQRLASIEARLDALE